MGKREGEKMIFFQRWLDRIEKLDLPQSYEDSLISYIVRMGEKEGASRKEIEEWIEKVEEQEKKKEERK